MRVVLFFKCLCYLLLQGHSAIYADSDHDNFHSVRAQYGRKNQQINRVYTGSDCLAVAIPYLVADLEDTLDDADDEDTHSFPAAAYGSSVKNYSIYVYPSYTSLLRHRSNRFKAAPTPFHSQASDIYLLQGVLRI